MGTIVWIAVSFAGVLLLWVLFVFMGRTCCMVNLSVPASRVRDFVLQYVPHGQDNSRTLIYRPVSGTLIGVAKAVPDGPAGKAVITVSQHKVRGRLGRRGYLVCRILSLPFKMVPWPDTVIVVPRRRLPSPLNAERIDVVACGASLKRTLSVVEEMLRADVSSPGEGRWNVWPENVWGGEVVGVFDNGAGD